MELPGIGIGNRNSFGIGMAWNGPARRRLWNGMEWNGPRREPWNCQELELAIAILLELEWNGPRREPWNWCGIVAILGNSKFPNSNSEFGEIWNCLELELAIAILLEWWNCNSNFPDCVELALPEARAGSGSWDGPAAQPA